jgi:hypothetical protein
MVRQVVTTKDLREMCLNGVTLDDIRRLYGINATLEDVELALPSLLVDDLGILPYSEVATKISESQIESQHTQEQEGRPGHDMGKENEIEEKVSTSQDEDGEKASISQDVSKEKESPSQDVSEEKANASQDVSEEKESPSQDEMEEEVSPTEAEKRERVLPPLSSAGQQVASKIEPEAPSRYDPLPSTAPWHPLLALCLFSPTSNILDVLTSLGVFSHLDGSV